jgi:hypothetical protein
MGSGVVNMASGIPDWEPGSFSHVTGVEIAEGISLPSVLGPRNDSLVVVEAIEGLKKVDVHTRTLTD